MLFRSGGWVNTSTVNYFSLTAVTTATTTIANADNTINVAGTLGSITITVSGNNLGSSNGVQFSLYKNGSSVSSCTVTGTTCTINFTGGSLSLVKGDTIAIATTKTGSGTNSNRSFTAGATFTWGTAAVV